MELISIRPSSRKRVSALQWLSASRAIARDDRPWGGADPPAVTDAYAPGRVNEHATKLLKDFRGILQTDTYVA